MCVQLFSSLYSMLPSAQKNLIKGNLSPNAAAWATIGCFLGGVIGIQFFSRLLHHFIPSHVVDCDHTHDDDEAAEELTDDHHHHNGSAHKHNGHVSESTPLLPDDNVDTKMIPGRRRRSTTAETTQKPGGPFLTAPKMQRPSLQNRLTARVSTFVSGGKQSCDEGGPCYGYSDPCSQGCFKTMNQSPTRASTRMFGRFSVSGPSGKPSLVRTATAPHTRAKAVSSEADGEAIHQISPRPTIPMRPAIPTSRGSAQAVFRGREGFHRRETSNLGSELAAENEDEYRARSRSTASATSTANDPAHHHHVPTNAFLAIGLQTSIAIALHKLPEGFITYATNHANPTLGFTVFMALFIHNITEGFAMALPLYLAINSRWKAMLVSSILGGISQPLGAGVAAFWFKVAGQGNLAPNDTVYGCMFAITAGIMASVALQLFSESLNLAHNRNTCTAFAFVGMAILGFSFALTAG